MASHSLLFPGLRLHSARLVLSPIRRDDAAALFTLQSNPDVMRLRIQGELADSAVHGLLADDDAAAPPCPLDPIWPVAASTHGHAFGHIRHGPPPA